MSQALAGSRKRSQETMAVGRNGQTRVTSGNSIKSGAKGPRKANENKFRFNEADDDIPENMYRPPDDDDPEGWVHRDKLAKIESEELQAAGINLANARRNPSRSMNRVPTYEEEKENIHEDLDEQGRPRQQPGKYTNPRSEMDLQDDPALDNMTFDASNPQMYSHNPSRKSGSKIPVSATSANPIPAERLEREKPMPRRRTISNTLTPEETNTILNSSRRVDDEQDHEDMTERPKTGQLKSTPKRASPTKSQSLSLAASPITPNGRQMTPMGKVTSITGRNVTPSSAQRPGTRSGDKDRPRTAVNRAEGDPPWVATMYKVDPMLPPDQQIIPTHARKLQQDQWNDEGAVPSAYDRSFQPVSIHNEKDLQRPPEQDTVESERDRIANILNSPAKASQHSLHSQAPLQKEVSNTSAGGGGTGVGYQSPPEMTNQTSMVHNISIVRPAPGAIRPAEMDYMEKGSKKSKACGCCIVM